MALFPSPFDPLLSLQQALDALRTSGWLDAGLSGGGTYPPVNVFRKGDDFAALIAEVPGIHEVAADFERDRGKGRTIRVSGAKSISYPAQASLHRRRGTARGPVRSGGHAAGRNRRGWRPGRMP